MCDWTFTKHRFKIICTNNEVNAKRILDTYGYPPLVSDEMIFLKSTDRDLSSSQKRHLRRSRKRIERYLFNQEIRYYENLWNSNHEDWTDFQACDFFSLTALP